MATINITIRMDEELKKQAEELFSDLGLSMTSAFIAFTKQSVREQRIPFNLSRNIPNSDTIKAIENVRNDTNMSKAFNSVAELMEDLNAED
ncbi:MAG: type II toxin-antitoxin system RelB/DinJ family antitoxin [Oscillospiraceae bacterium]